MKLKKNKDNKETKETKPIEKTPKKQGKSVVGKGLILMPAKQPPRNVSCFIPA